MGAALDALRAQCLQLWQPEYRFLFTASSMISLGILLFFPLRRLGKWDILTYALYAAHAGVAELADAYGSGPYESNLMKVQVLSPAPLRTNGALRGAFWYNSINETIKKSLMRMLRVGAA